MKPKPIRAAVGLGSNLGDRLRHMQQALRALQRIPQTADHRFSNLIETEAVDCPEPYPFLNAAATFLTQLDPHKLLAELQAIETDMGRERSYPNAPRPIDLDLLLFGDQRINTPTLVVPHPRMWERDFVLRPLNSILFFNQLSQKVFCEGF